MADNPDLKSLHLNVLRSRCADESERFFHHQGHDPRFCYEIFRRAFLEQDQRAWESIYQQYKPLVSGWVEHHSLFCALDEEKDYFVNRAFEKMWAAITSQEFGQFPDLKSLLRYLQICVHSVLVDAMRAREQAELFGDTPPQLARLEDPNQSLSLEDQVTHRFQAQQLWDLLNERCKNKREHLVIYGSFVLAFKPSELLSAFPDVFQDVNEVYRLKENLLARLKRDSEFMDFLGSVQ